MTRWLRRIRGAIGIGLIWTAAWCVAGGVLARVPGFDSDLPFPLLFAPLGFVTGVLFSGILVATERGHRVAHMSLSRFAGCGAMGGLLLSAIIVVAAVWRGESAWGELLVFGPPLTLAGAASAVGSLALARRAQRWRGLLGLIRETG